MEPCAIAPHVKSAKPLRSDRVGSRVIPANSVDSTRRVEGRNFRASKASEIVVEAVSSERSRSRADVLMRHRRKRKPSAMPTDLSVGSRYFGERRASPRRRRFPVVGSMEAVHGSMGLASSASTSIQRLTVGYAVCKT